MRTRGNLIGANRSNSDYIASMRTISIAAVTVILSVAALAGTAKATDTHEEYVAQVSPICKSAARQAKKIPSRIDETGNAFLDGVQRAALWGKLLSKTIRRIASVDPPPGQEAAVKSWLDEGRRLARLIRKLVGAVKRHEAGRARVLIKRFGMSLSRGQRKATKLGLTACVREPG
jgi:hypothetical protein